MKLDLAIMPSGNPRHDMAVIKRAEQLGFDAAWVAEAAHNPYLPLTLAATETSRIRLGAQVALAVPRSPMVTAQIAWDLSRQSRGRFILGLGSQTQAHIEGRFSEEWKDPVGRMREYIESLRAIWNTFQTDARLRYRGEHYQFRLMAPFFNPGPISHPAIPIYLAGVNPGLCQLAGEICHGLHAHAFHTRAYLRDVVLPAVEAGLRTAERTRREFTLAVPVSVISGKNELERRRASKPVRERLAIFASAPTYREVMRKHGWENLADELSALARDQRWDEMTNAITDDVLEEFAVIAEPGDVNARLLEAYRGLADRVCLLWNAESRDVYEAIASVRDAS